MVGSPTGISPARVGKEFPWTRARGVERPCLMDWTWIRVDRNHGARYTGWFSWPGCLERIV